jgi:peptidoglycan hydrolase-like protein with peptidoglycan-binding domain
LIIGSGGGTPSFTAFTNIAAAPSQNLFVTCPLLDTYLGNGGHNDPVEVVKLQAFLKNVEGSDVDVNGIFDQKTLAAVNAFQTKYLSAVMGPWGADHSSGYVYITTRKEINLISCNVAFVISPAEQAIINAYIAGQVTVPVPIQTNAGGVTPPVTTQTVVPGGSTTTPGIGQNDTGSILAIPVANAATIGSNIAGAAGATGTAVSSIFGRSWNFFTGLFSR